jgi:hypothetical protein
MSQNRFSAVPIIPWQPDQSLEHLVRKATADLNPTESLLVANHFEQLSRIIRRRVTGKESPLSIN